MGSVFAYLAIILVQLGLSERQATRSIKTNRKLQSIAKAIYTKISRNQDLINKLDQAYSEKNNQLLTSLMQGAGFGPRSTMILKALQIAKEEYQNMRSKYEKENAALNNDYNTASQAQYNTSTIAGNEEGKRIADQMEQYIEGGYQEGLWANSNVNPQKATTGTVVDSIKQRNMA